MNKPLKLIFMGTPEIAVPTLEALSLSKNVSIELVISMPDRPSGRGNKLKSPEVIEFSKNNNIKVYQTENINRDSELKEICEAIQPDLIIVFAFAQFLSSYFLNLPSIGCFNIHTSLLPKYRGAAPIQYAILNGDTKSGVSIQKMVKKMDAGDIAQSDVVDIDEGDSSLDLYNKLMKQAPISCIGLIDKIINGNISYAKQDEANVTFAPTLSKTDGLIDFTKNTKIEILRKLKAFSPWPGIYTYLNSKRLKIFEITFESQSVSPGVLNTDLLSLSVGCLDGTVRLSQVQLEGKKRCSDIELLNGLKNKYDTFQISSKEQA